MGFGLGDIFNPVGAAVRNVIPGQAGQIGGFLANPIGAITGGAVDAVTGGKLPNLGNPFPGLEGPSPGAFVDPNLEANKKLLEEYRNRIGGQAQTGFDQSQQARAGQNTLLGQLQSRAAGTGGPSVAEMQMQRGLEANRNQLASQAASAPAGGGALNQRNLMRQQAQAGQQAVADTGMLRAQEQQQAEQSLAGLLGQQRGQDMQQQGAADQLTQQYLQMGLGLDQAQFLANQRLNELSVNAASARRDSEQRMAGGLLGGITGGLASIFGGGK
jgi:hypothetical protein